jgi:hypothetical protein
MLKPIREFDVYVRAASHTFLRTEKTHSRYSLVINAITKVVVTDPIFSREHIRTTWMMLSVKGEWLVAKTTDCINTQNESREGTVAPPVYILTR